MRPTPILCTIAAIFVAYVTVWPTLRAGLTTILTSLIGPVLLTLN